MLITRKADKLTIFNEYCLLNPGQYSTPCGPEYWSTVNAGLRRADEDQSEVLVMLVQTSGELASGHSATGAQATEVRIATFRAIFLPTYAAVQTTSTSEDIRSANRLFASFDSKPIAPLAT
jgi:hypothetical protein